MLCAATMLACVPAPTRADLAGKCLQRIAAYQSDSGATVAASIVDLRTGKTLLSLRPGRKMIPASNQKLVAAIGALARLGSDFSFNTSLYMHEGNLCLAGDCDPTLGDPVLARAEGKSIYAELDRWALAFKRIVGNRWRGRIIAYANPPAGDAWQHPAWSDGDKAKWYGAPVAALGFHNNCYDVTFAIKGSKVYPKVSPAGRFIRITDRTRRGRRQIWLLRPEDNESGVLIRGKVARASSEPISAPCKNPPLLLARVLAGRIAAKGVKLAVTFRHERVPQTPQRGARLIAQTNTPISAIVARANKRSLNMAAECLLLRAGNGQWDDSSRLVGATLSREFNLSPGAFEISDGSGLSRKNRVTAEGMTALLAGVLKTPAGEILLDSLPISGTDGSLDDRLDAEAYTGRVRAKTGYIYGVCCLSGYVYDAAGKPAMAFSILANDVPGGKAYIAKRMQDDICRLLVDHLDK
jgi:D-alanyl-D-alanine carboxypeptidase/D-alanyl-D-alanine-endopeptidase (penicillin-binding protein 4)